MTQQGSPLVVKLRLNDDVRKIALYDVHDLSLSDMIGMAQRVFSVSTGVPLCLKYRDNESDWITLADDNDVVLARQTVANDLYIKVLSDGCATDLETQLLTAERHLTDIQGTVTSLLSQISETRRAQANPVVALVTLSPTSTRTSDTSVVINDHQQPSELAEAAEEESSTSEQYVQEHSASENGELVVEGEVQEEEVQEKEEAQEEEPIPQQQQHSVPPLQNHVQLQQQATAPPLPSSIAHNQQHHVAPPMTNGQTLHYFYQHPQQMHVPPPGSATFAPPSSQQYFYQQQPIPIQQHVPPPTGSTHGFYQQQQSVVPPTPSSVVASVTFAAPPGPPQMGVPPSSHVNPFARGGQIGYRSSLCHQ